MGILVKIDEPGIATASKHLRTALMRFGFFAAVLSLAFFTPLLNWMRLALNSSTFSYVILIPFIVVYLVRLELKRCLTANDEFRGSEEDAASSQGMIGRLVEDEAGHLRRVEKLSGRQIGLAAGCWIIALVSMIVHWFSFLFGWTPSPESSVALTMLAYYLGLLGGGFIFLGVRTMRRLRFAAAFLVFITPFPTGVTDIIEIFFQHTSAEVSYWFLTWSGTPILRDGLSFKIPGITMRVAQECSGIRSSLVLFISSLLAGHLFLRTWWRKVVLTLFVIPLAIVRNGLRILTIGLLCVHAGPEMIDSPIHHRGGPIFFALSLIPFFLTLWWLVRSERKSERHASFKDAR